MQKKTKLVRKKVAKKAVKKKTIKPTLEHDTLKQIQSDLDKFGFVVIIVERQYQLRRHTGGLLNYISYSDTNQAPHCCGTREIGDLSFDTTNITKQLKEPIKLLIRYAFLSTKKNNEESNEGKIRTAKTILFFSNGNYSCTLVEDALEGWHHYKHVATSRNNVHGNIIKSYITP